MPNHRAISLEGAPLATITGPSAAHSTSQRIDLRQLLVLLSAGLLAGCSLPAVGPDYRAPATPGSTGFKDSAPVSFGQPERRLAHEWWREFGDQDLEGLIAEALRQNQDVAAAIARVEQARALSGSARSGTFPMIGATGMLTREQSSETTSNLFPHSLTTTYRTPLTLSWELDLFGRVRRLGESAQAGLKASEELAELARLSVAAETATTYFALSATDQELRLVSQALGLQRQMLALVEARRDAGRSSELAVEQASMAVSASEAELAGVRSRRSTLKNGLAILLGQAAPDFDIEGRTPLRDTLPEVPVGLPSDLLQRRPDLAAAESGLRAANAQVGVAKAAFFPAISLTGSAGHASAEIDSLFQRDSRAWSIGPSLYLPLFQGGRNRANLRHRQAAYEEAVAGYRQAILNAFREVQDALTSSQRLTEQAEAIARAVTSARRVRALTEERYHSDATSSMELLEAEGTLLSVERSAAAITGQRWMTRVTLIRALGGGWEQPKSL